MRATWKLHSAPYMEWGEFSFARKSYRPANYNVRVIGAKRRLQRGGVEGVVGEGARGAGPGPATSVCDLKTGNSVTGRIKVSNKSE